MLCSDLFGIVRKGNESLCIRGVEFSPKPFGVHIFKKTHLELLMSCDLSFVVAYNGRSMRELYSQILKSQYSPQLSQQ